MKIDYVTSTRGDYVIVQYYVTIYCEDDGAHFPAYSFSHWFLLKGDEVSKTDDEIYEKVLDGLKGCIKDRYGYTLEELEADPAFRRINISVSKELNYDKQIDLTK